MRIGLERLRDAATRTEALGPHIAVLRALRDHRNPDAGVCEAVADVIGTITVSITDTDHEAIDDVVELLDGAQAYAQDNTGERIDRALGGASGSGTFRPCSSCRSSLTRRFRNSTLWPPLISTVMTVSSSGSTHRAACWPMVSPV
ncbi:hypothetical protein [Streptomyces durhamensis]|uniref:hypothetical protein n=1 Tax=Streptomyces durhamensis TaxID=68194 RepID=UPI000AF8A40F|nr:hypothetical protein [Streptomyces durhamensis]